ncbi:glucose-6-phosphate isomerase, partial [Acinetobacter baumannii]
MSKSIEQFPKDLSSPLIQLKSSVEKNSKLHIKELFALEPERFQNYSVKFDQLFFDYSKQRITKNILEQLVALANNKQLTQWINRLFSQDKINCTEQREAMHWALRLPSEYSKFPELTKQVHIQLQRMYTLVEKIHAGQYRGATGEVIQDVVNIGVGGSDLGPHMVTHALADFKVKTAKPLNVHFVSTMDGSQLSDLLHQLRPETTLFIISSKSFGTIDTLSNAQTVRQWLEKALGKHDRVVKSHFIGVSTKAEKMNEWGIAPDNQLLLWDWVGGRYSLWSCIGFPIALTIGIDGFQQLLAGAHAVDEHFQNTSFERNIPVLMALLGIWNN